MDAGCEEGVVRVRAQVLSGRTATDLGSRTRAPAAAGVATGVAKGAAADAACPARSSPRVPAIASCPQSARRSESPIMAMSTRSSRRPVWCAMEASAATSLVSLSPSAVNSNSQESYERDRETDCEEDEQHPHRPRTARRMPGLQRHQPGRSPMRSRDRRRQREKRCVGEARPTRTLEPPRVSRSARVYWGYWRSGNYLRALSSRAPPVSSAPLYTTAIA